MANDAENEDNLLLTFLNSKLINGNRKRSSNGLGKPFSRMQEELNPRIGRAVCFPQGRLSDLPTPTHILRKIFNFDD